MLVLGRDDIEDAVDLSTLVVAIEQAFIAASAGEVELPPVGHLTFPDVEGDCHIKFGHRRGDPVFVVKVATGFPRQASSGLPTGNGLSLVVSATTGDVHAVLHDEMVLTDIRTAVAGAISTRLLARPDAATLLVVGTGVQARRQIEAHTALLGRPLDVQVWGRSLKSARRLEDDVGSIIDVEVIEDLGVACGRADIIVTATGAMAPIIDNEWVRPGTHITAVGADAPGKHELDAALVRRADLLVCDSRAQCLDHGEFSIVANDGREVVEIGELLAGYPVHRAPDDITIADLTGTAAQDLAAAGHVLDRLS